MGDYRAEKRGFAADAHNKMQSKWSNECAVTALNWVSQMTGFTLPPNYNGDMGETQAFLHDGYVLLKLVDACCPGKVPSKLMGKPQTMPFKQREAIGIFLDVLQNQNLVSDTERFQTVDLFENMNMPSVLTTLEALGRKMQSQGKGFGKAESHGEKKNWTDEQLRAGQNIIGLQMGSNQGANQSGQNFGKARKIVD